MLNLDSKIARCLHCCCGGGVDINIKKGYLAVPAELDKKGPLKNRWCRVYVVVHSWIGYS